MHADTKHDGLTSLVAIFALITNVTEIYQVHLLMIRNVAEHVRDWHLNEEPHGRHCIALQCSEPEAFDNDWPVGIEAAKWAIVEERDQDVQPYLPVAEL